MGLLAPEAFPLEAAEVLLDDPFTARVTLVARGLVRLEGEEPVFTHALGYSHAREQASQPPDLLDGLGAWLCQRLEQSLREAAASQRDDRHRLDILHLSTLGSADSGERLWRVLATLNGEPVPSLRALARMAAEYEGEFYEFVF